MRDDSANEEDLSDEGRPGERNGHPGSVADDTAAAASPEEGENAYVPRHARPKADPGSDAQTGPDMRHAAPQVGPGRVSTAYPGRYGDPVEITQVKWSNDYGKEYPERPLFLLIHGFGSSMLDMDEFFRVYISQFVDFVAPEAPYDLSMYQGMFPGAATWFHDSVPTGEDLDRDVWAASHAIDQWVLANVPDERKVIPIGFSQGGCLATHLLRIDPKRYAAAATLSGFLAPATVPGVAPFDAQLASLDRSVFYGTGAADDVIPKYESKAYAAWLDDHTHLTMREYPNLDHSIGIDEVDDLRDWLVAIDAISGLR